MSKKSIAILLILLALSVGYSLLKDSGDGVVVPDEQSNVEDATGSAETDGDIAELDNIMIVDDEGVTKVDETALKAALSEKESISLASSEEASGAIFMLEEEKLAHDVYITLYDIWGMRVFDNISQSEKTHIEAVRSLAEAYDIPIVFYDEEIGVFHDEKLAGLYTELTERGSKSLDEAFRVGVLIEELDIVDLQSYIDATDNQDFVTVYENLQKGSRNHLRAFAKNISGEYEPVYMTQEEYDAVLSTGTERGRN
jgi:hypothetical protein